MKDCVIVKVLRRNKVQSSLFFNDYDVALDYAIRQGWKGCYTIILRKYKDKKWAKTYLIPPETI